MRKLLFLLTLLPVFANAGGLIAYVEHDTDSVIVRFPIWDYTDPKSCATVSDTTDGLEFRISSDVSNGLLDTFECQGSNCATTDTLATIATFGTFSTPPANSANFGKVTGTVCLYELQMPNTIYATTDATQINIGVTCGGSTCLNEEWWVDLSPVSVATLGETDCSSYSTPNTFFYQVCTVLNAVLTDTGTTLEQTVNTIKNNTDYDIIASENADSGNAGGTTLVDADALAGNIGDDVINAGAKLYVTFSTGVEARCVRDYVDVSGTVTVYPAFSAQITTEAFKLVADVDCRTFP